MVLEGEGYQHRKPENLRANIRVIWLRGTPFNHEVVNELLGREHVFISNPILGDGFEWNIPSNTNTSLRIYPTPGLAVVSYVDSAEEHKSRNIPITSIVEGSDGDSISIVSQVSAVRSTTHISRNGDVIDINKSFREDFETIKPEYDLVEAELTTRGSYLGLFTAEDVLSTLGALNPQYTYDIRRFKPTPSVAAYMKLFDKRPLDSLKALVEGSLEYAERLQLSDEERLSIHFIVERYVEGKTIAEVASSLGYSREHASRKFLKAGLNLFLDLMKKSTAEREAEEQA